MAKIRIKKKRNKEIKGIQIDRSEMEAILLSKNEITNRMSFLMLDSPTNKHHSYFFF